MSSVVSATRRIVDSFDILICRFTSKPDGGKVLTLLPNDVDLFRTHVAFLQIRSYNLGYLVNGSTQDSACAFPLLDSAEYKLLWHVYDPAADEHAHPSEEVSVFVLRIGHFVVDGKHIEVGYFEIDSSPEWSESWFDIRFKQSFPTVPAVFCTCYAPPYCAAVVKAIAKDYFTVAAQHYEGSGKVRVAYLAIEHGYYPSLDLWVGTVDADYNPRRVNFPKPFTEPDVLGQIDTANGLDGRWVRFKTLTNTYAEVCVEERPGRDGPHVTERIAVLVAENVVLAFQRQMQLSRRVLKEERVAAV